MHTLYTLNFTTLTILALALCITLFFTNILLSLITVSHSMYNVFCNNCYLLYSPRNGVVKLLSVCFGSAVVSVMDSPS